MNSHIEVVAVVFLSLGTLLSHQCTHALFGYFCLRYYLRQRQFTTKQLVREIVTGEGFFTLVYSVWLELYGDTIIDYTPVLLYSLITLIEIKEQT
jgi:hypothetical protein